MGVNAIYEGVLKKNNIKVQVISAKWSGDGIIAPQQSIWELEPFNRGDIIHQMMGANLNRDFPVLDIYDYYTKEAVSIISINTQDDSYQSGLNFKSKIKQQIDTLSCYTYATSGDVKISNEDICQKSVLVVIPNEQLTDQQVRQINEMMSYAESLDIRLKIKKYQKISN